MSQDLFAAFGDEDTGQIWGSEPRGQHVSPASNDAFEQPWAIDDTARWIQEDVPPKPTRLDDDDDDDFGDFEDASASHAADDGSIRGSKTVTSIRDSSPKLSQTTAKSFPPKAPLRQSLKASPSKPPEKQQNVGQHPFAGHMDLLFETGDDEYDAGADELGDLSTNPEAAMAYSKRIIAEQEAALARANGISSPIVESSKARPGESTNHPPVPRHVEKKSQNAPARDPNILFDADDLSEQDDEDDFDDFESGNGGNEIASLSPEIAQPQRRTTMPAMDLLGLDDTSPNESWVSGNDKLSDNRTTPQLSNDRPTRTVMTSAATAKPEDDSWDDFETAAPSDDPWSSDQPFSPPNIAQSRLVTTKTTPKEQDRLPPTNVPPPAVLLSVFPTVFAEADDALFNAIGKLDVKQKQMLLAHPASHQFLKSYLGHCTVLARIIAGRKSRWKRDQRLSQSMRIGPAAAGGKGGMKLTGLDKSEVAKEDREVLDVLRLWKSQVGKLRTAVTTASSAPLVPKLPPVPEIAEQMAVKTLKSSEGGITALQPCALCGLKREERVAKVDVEVDDNFGEWWVQGMSMHLSCRNFWDEFERKLKSR